MGCDMLLALGRATVTGATHLALNRHHDARQPLLLCRQPGRTFAAGETVPLAGLELPQARQTATVLGGQLPGHWGYEFGVNEHRLALGYAGWASRLATPDAPLSAADLVRLALERCHTAHQAADLLADLLARHGHAADGADAIFALADPTEACVVEAAGRAWACQEVREVRAVSDVGLIRKDWDHLSRGLADEVIARGWWECDGNKLDFAATVGVADAGRADALRRWGRATLFLERHNGHIDGPFLRRALTDHYEGTRHEFDPVTASGTAAPLCRHGADGTAASFAACLAADDLPLAWCAFGPPCVSVHLPLFLIGELPPAWTTADAQWRQTRQLLAALGTDAARWAEARAALTQFQAEVDQDAEEFRQEAPDLRRHDGDAAVNRQAGLLMQSHAERHEAVLGHLLSGFDPRRELVTAAAPRRTPAR